MTPTQQHLLDSLERELRTTTGFVRIHAAEALVEHGYGYKVDAALRSEMDSATPPYRIGAWRVLARDAAEESQRQHFVTRIRRTLRDASAPDRLHAVETLAKLCSTDRDDRPTLEAWLLEAADGAAAFALWLLVLSANVTERAGDEARLAALLDSPDETARLRAAYALMWLENLSAESITALRRRAEIEPRDSGARIHIVSATFLHALSGSAEAAQLKNELLACLRFGKSGEKFEAARTLGLRGNTGDVPALAPLLIAAKADVRIAAANALLHLLK